MCISKVARPGQSFVKLRIEEVLADMAGVVRVPFDDKGSTLSAIISQVLAGDALLDNYSCSKRQQKAALVLASNNAVTRWQSWVILYIPRTGCRVYSMH